MKRLDHNGQHFYEAAYGRFVAFSDVEVLLAELNLLRSQEASAAAALRVVRAMLRGNPLEHAIVDPTNMDEGLGAYIERHLPQEQPSK